METEIKAIIEKNLPAQVGDVLKQRLEQAEKDASKVKLQQQEIETKVEVIRLLEARLNDYSEFDSRNSLLEAREKTVDQTERNLKIETLEFQILAEKEKTQFAKDVALGLVRNTEYKRTLFDSKSTPMNDQYGNTQYPTATQNSDETKTAK